MHRALPLLLAFAGFVLAQDNRQLFTGQMSNGRAWNSMPEATKIAYMVGILLCAIERCRTAALGGHVEECDRRGHQRFAYNSCGNLHCPKCQSLARAKWLDKRQSELLPVEYFHVVFTLPEPLAALALQNKRLLYGILFQAAAESLQSRSSANDLSSPTRDRK